ncbi:MAG: hypothetical protein EOP22_17065 [Hyphomicrobiales bacterium]|nr:MAG: hypothetical protein EOP22_17065 [Hyphomicrobiales bacterium]
MGGLFEQKIWGVPWTALAGVALLVALVYLVWDLSGDATGWRWAVSRWFHSLCWLLLALAALAKAQITPLPADWAGALAIAGGLIYAIYIGAGLIG